MLTSKTALLSHTCHLCVKRSEEHLFQERGEFLNSIKDTFRLGPRPADLTEVCKVKEDEYIIKVVTGGTKSVGKTSLCPPYGRTILVEDIETIISYLKTFP